MGMIEVDWQIGADGEVLDVAIIRSDFDNAALNGVLKGIRETRFPPPPGGLRTYVSHKFIFKKAESA